MTDEALLQDAAERTRSIEPQYHQRHNAEMVERVEIVQSGNRHLTNHTRPENAMDFPRFEPR